MYNSYLNIELAPEFEYILRESELGTSRNTQEYIKWVQASLNRIMRLKIAIDGIMSPATRSAIRSFQKQNRLTADGIIGPQTEAALKRVAGNSSSSMLSALQTQPAQPVSKTDCKKLLILDGFETSHYRMLPRHYEPLMNFLIGFEKSPPPAGTTLPIVGHTDDQGPELMNEGLSINRALEVKRFVDHVLAKLVTRKRLPSLIPTEAFARGEVDKISPSPEKNRRVELGLCKPI